MGESVILKAAWPATIFSVIRKMSQRGKTRITRLDSRSKERQGVRCGTHGLGCWRSEMAEPAKCQTRENPVKIQKGATSRIKDKQRKDSAKQGLTCKSTCGLFSLRSQRDLLYEWSSDTFEAIKIQDVELVDQTTDTKRKDERGISYESSPSCQRWWSACFCM